MDLEGIKNEIAEKKKEKISQSIALGENVDHMMPAKSDTILFEIQQSLMTGQSNDTVDKIKKVDKLAAIKKANKYSVSNNGLSESLMEHVDFKSPPSQQPITQRQPTIDREKLFEEQLINTRKNDQGLSDILSAQHNKISPTMENMFYQQNPQQLQQVNNKNINEQVNDTVNNYLKENFGGLVQKLMKNTIIEMYSVEKVKESLFENKKYIKKIIYETLQELAKEKEKRIKTT